MDFMQINLLFSGHGFGINTNIFETNVINLAIVITVVISFVGDALRDVLDNRKKTILDNLNAASARALEIEEKLNNAKRALEDSNVQAQQIREQTLIAIEREKHACMNQADDEIKRLNKLKDNTIRSHQQKAIREISQKVINLSLKQARKKVNQRVQSRTSHYWVNIMKIRSYGPILNQITRF